MKRITLVAITVVALIAVAISIPSRNTATAATLQPQIKSKPGPELKLRWLSGVTLNKLTTVGGSVDGDITGTVHLMRAALSNLTISLVLEGHIFPEAGALANLPVSVITISAGRDRATFRIRTFSLQGFSGTTCTVRARYDDESVSANFTVDSLRMVSCNILPTAGFGPFTANGTITLNAPPAANQTVTLTSNNPVVRFGTVGNAQTSTSVTFTSTNNLRTFQVVASAVSQPTTVTITARLGAQTLTRQIIVRPAI